MPYTSKVTATRPENTKWFNAAHPEMSKGEIDWTKSQPGFVSLTVETPAPNTLVSTLVFEDQASFEAMAALRAQRDDYKERKLYCALNGITRTVERG